MGAYLRACGSLVVTHGAYESNIIISHNIGARACVCVCVRLWCAAHCVTQFSFANAIYCRAVDCVCVCDVVVALMSALVLL